VKRVEPGIHGLSNAFLDTPWPKVSRGKDILKNIIKSGNEHPESQLFQMLADTYQPPDSELPDTGIGPVWERMLAPMFIKGDIYRTRASSVILISYSGAITFVEKSFIRNTGNDIVEEIRSFELD
jgi:uncharacterized protein with NRDE domain